jgi:DNA-binding CsgD family transcriptional regulator
MLDYAKIDVKAVHEFLLELELARTRQDFLNIATAGVERLIPLDVAMTFFNKTDILIFNHGFNDDIREQFNNHYRFLLPFVPDPDHFLEFALALSRNDGCSLVEWDDYANSEFVSDFTSPLHDAYNLACFLPGINLVPSLHRSYSSSNFTETECATLAMITPHMNNLYSSLERFSGGAMAQLSEDEIEERFPKLKHREIQVGMLLCSGLTAPEIASRLLLSKRTAESHIASLYQSLGVHSKRQAIDAIMGNPA